MGIMPDKCLKKNSMVTLLLLPGGTEKVPSLRNRFAPARGSDGALILVSPPSRTVRKTLILSVRYHLEQTKHFLWASASG